MKSYRVFKHPAGKVEAVKQGWSWPGFFFTFIWAFVKRLWVVGGVILVLAFGAGVVLDSMMSDSVNSAVSNVMGLVVSLVVGVRGNIWRENNLLSRGYEHVASLAAQNPESAIAEYLKPSEPALDQDAQTPNEPPAV